MNRCDESRHCETCGRRKAKENPPETEGFSPMRKRKLPDERNELVIRLDEETCRALSLTNEEIIMIDDLADLPSAIRCLVHYLNEPNYITTS
jgi:hypothetical protein